MQKANFKGLIFDMDGTIVDLAIDFEAIRRELGIHSGDLSEAIKEMPGAECKNAWDVIEAHEDRAREKQKLKRGTKNLFHRCRDNGIRVGLITRNRRVNVDHLCKRFGLHFDAVVTREFTHIKPHPKPVLHIIKQWDIAPHEVLMVGDYIYDIECGKRAGTQTCFFQNPDMPFYGQEADFTVSSMRELESLVFSAGQ